MGVALKSKSAKFLPFIGEVKLILGRPKMTEIADQILMDMVQKKDIKQIV